MVRVAEHLVTRGHEPLVIAPRPSSGARSVTGSLPYQVIRIPSVPIPGKDGVVPGCGVAGAQLSQGRAKAAGARHHEVRHPNDDLAPDRIEVSDRFTLRWTGKWAADRGVRSVMVSHESLTGVLTVAGLPAALSRAGADRFNARTARAFDTVVRTTGWAAAEFRRIGVTNVFEAPLGVGLDVFHPSRYSAAVRSRYALDSQILLVHCGRLSPEKAPDVAIDTLIGLRRQGVDATLVMAGDGPLRDRLMRRAAGYPAYFVEFVAERVALAALLASADVVLAPGPIETFGLAALEALACGTPVVVEAASALPEVVGRAGAAVTSTQFPSGVLDVLGRPESERRAAARARAERFGWPAAVDGFLAAHDLGVFHEIGGAR